MFLDREITPELELELRKQQVVVAHSRNEAGEKAKDFNAEFYIPGDIAASILNDILTEWKGPYTPWSALQGLRVLDLASGSANSTNGYRTWYPHFSRFCAINGAHVTAIDINPQSGLDETMFEWAQADLAETVYDQGLQNLPILLGKKYDIIHSMHFIGPNFSPELVDRLGFHLLLGGDFGERFFNQAGELLAEDGVMSLDNKRDDEYDLPVLYTKKGADIVELK